MSETVEAPVEANVALPAEFALPSEPEGRDHPAVALYADHIPDLPTRVDWQEGRMGWMHYAAPLVDGEESTAPMADHLRRNASAIGIGPSAWAGTLALLERLQYHPSTLTAAECRDELVAAWGKRAPAKLADAKAMLALLTDGWPELHANLADTPAFGNSPQFIRVLAGMATQARRNRERAAR